MFSGGIEALEWIENNTSLCAVVITDLDMPDLMGDSVIKRVKIICPSIPCYLITGHEIKANSLQISDSDLSGFLSKPINFCSIEDIIRQVFNCNTGK